jgi:hypothetical protein
MGKPFDFGSRISRDLHDDEHAGNGKNKYTVVYTDLFCFFLSMFMDLYYRYTEYMVIGWTHIHW